MEVRGSDKRQLAMTLVEVVVVMLALGVLFFMLLPALATAHQKSARIHCVDNLKETYVGFKIWEGDHNDQYPMEVSTNQGGALEYVEHDELFRFYQAASNVLLTPKILTCPADVRQSAADWTSLQNSNISYFLCLDATEAYPGMIILGDRNVIGGTRSPNGLTVFNPADSVHWGSDMHHGSGNIGLTDGSVAQMTSHGLSEAFAQATNAGLSTIHYAFP